jgi:putative SOS response-associated peptidase YedK
MCGRFVGFRPVDALTAHFPIDVATVEASENFNVAPSQKVLAIARYKGKNHLVKFHWGLVPSWATDKSIGNRLINARSETAATKPSFRTAFRKRRCLVLADGFYEWKGEKGKKQPMFLTLPDGSPFAFAGLWENWDGGGTEKHPYRSCTILTRDASPSVRPIHHRMPVILKASAYGPWLDPANRSIDSLQELIRNHIHTELTAIPVSTQVNSVRNNRADNIRQIQLFPE